LRLGITDRSVLCIDWDERSLRVVDARFSRSGVRIHKAVEARLASGTDVRDPASVGAFLRRTLGEHRIRTRRAIVDIPRQDAVLNLLNLPGGSADELAAMVHIQIGKDLPFSKEQAVIDFAVSREEGAGTCEVWVSAVRTHVIDHYQQVIRAAGLKLEGIGLRPYASLAAVAGSEAAEGRTLMLDIGPAMTEINVIRDGRLVYSRAASVSVPEGGLSGVGEGGAVARPAPGEGTGGPPLTLADDSTSKPAPMSALLIEVSRTIEAYRATDPGAVLDRIILAGMAGIDDAVREAFEARFASPTAIYQAPPSMHWRGAEAEWAAPFSAAIGLAISHVTEGMRRFDFLHPKEPEAARRERARRAPIMAATIALFVAAAAVLAYNPIRQRSAEVEQLKDEIAELEKDSKQRRSFMKRYADLEEWQRSNVVWLDVIQQVLDAFPSTEEAYVTKLDCSRDKGAVTLEIAAKHRKVGTEFLTRVKEIKGTVTGETGRQRTVGLFDGEPGDAKQNVKDPKYPVKHSVVLQIEALQRKKKK